MKSDFPICTYSPNPLLLPYLQAVVFRELKTVIHNLLIGYLLSVNYVLGGGESIAKMTDTVFLIVYLPNPLAKGFGDTVLVTKVPHSTSAIQMVQ